MGKNISASKQLTQQGRWFYLDSFLTCLTYLLGGFSVFFNDGSVLMFTYEISPTYNRAEMLVQSRNNSFTRLSEGLSFRFSWGDSCNCGHLYPMDILSDVNASQSGSGNWLITIFGALQFCFNGMLYFNFLLLHLVFVAWTNNKRLKIKCCILFVLKEIPA